MISFFVEGIPQPKGSMRAFVVKGRAIVTADNTKTKPWAATIIAAARSHAPAEPIDVPCQVVLSFRLPRLKLHMGKNGTKPGAPVWQSKKPDVDKLARNALDALTKAGFWTDDSRVAALTATKTFSKVPGLEVKVSEL